MADPSIIGRDGGSADFPLDRSKVRELVLAIEETDAVYTDLDAAREAGFEALPAPLTWPILIGHWRPGRELLEGLGLDYGRLLNGGARWEYVRPVLVGEEIRATRTVTDVKRKDGKRGGTMTLVEFETVFRDADGEVVARQFDTLIETGDA